MSLTNSPSLPLVTEADVVRVAGGVRFARDKFMEAARSVGASLGVAIADEPTAEGELALTLAGFAPTPFAIGVAIARLLESFGRETVIIPDWNSMEVYSLARMRLEYFGFWDFATADPRVVAQHNAAASLWNDIYWIAMRSLPLEWQPTPIAVVNPLMLTNVAATLGYATVEALQDAIQQQQVASAIAILETPEGWSLAQVSAATQTYLTYRLLDFFNEGAPLDTLDVLPEPSEEPPDGIGAPPVLIPSALPEGIYLMGLWDTIGDLASGISGALGQVTDTVTSALDRVDDVIGSISSEGERVMREASGVLQAGVNVATGIRQITGLFSDPVVEDIRRRGSDAVAATGPGAATAAQLTASSQQAGAFSPGFQADIGQVLAADPFAIPPDPVGGPQMAGFAMLPAVGGAATSATVRQLLARAAALLGAGAVVGAGAELVAGNGGGAGAFFRQPGTRSRPVRRIQRMDPTTERIHTWEHAGTPVLYSRDFRVVRRVRRVASKARRRVGGR
jgi:hypothetical protein